MASFVRSSCIRKGHPHGDQKQAILSQDQLKLKQPFKIPSRFEEDPPAEELSPTEEEDTQVVTEEDQPVKEADAVMDGEEPEDEDEDDEADFREHIFEFAMANGVATAKNLFAVEIRRAEKKLGKQPALKKQKK